ncbi:MAG: nucleotide sugar dehydrogenase [Candidatus Hydrogenedentes bacterium]|nr:nucleotide sugar dehydrogenase [Candidatus Hydrogenedentota bacterium]
MKAALESKLNDQTAVAGVIGLGYVGLPLVQHLCGAGYRVIGFDVDQSKVDRLNAGESYIHHIDSAWIARIVAEGRFVATSDFERLAEADCISICVPTPLNRHHEPDLQYVEQTTAHIAAVLRPGQLVVLESTTYPGTTTELLLPMLSASGLRVGQDFFLAFSPEREDPGNARFTISKIPKVIGGVTPACTALAAAYYEKIFECVVPLSGPAAAELCKLLENIFRSVNIALVNELKMLCDKMGIDIWEVIHAASTKPFGFMPFYPGPGLGGHCIPIDPFYLSWKAREHDFVTRFIELSGEINTSMPLFVVNKLAEALNHAAKPLNGARILILGAAYKKDVDDMRESPTIKLIELLEERHALVDYNDPYIPEIVPGRHHSITKRSVALTPQTLASYDVVLISTAHTCYDVEMLLDHANLVVDTRNLTGAIPKSDPRLSIVVKA